MQFQTESTGDLEDCVESRAALRGERLIEAFSREPGVSGNLDLPFGTVDIANGLGDKGGITIRFFQAGFQTSGHFLRLHIINGTCAIARRHRAPQPARGSYFRGN